MSHTEASVSSVDHTLEAVITLVRELKKIAPGARYALLGGAACCLLSWKYDLEARGTDDIDLVVDPATISAEDLSDLLCKGDAKYFIQHDQYGVMIPAVRIKSGQELEVEIFDVTSWPNRPQYNLNSPDNPILSLEIGGSTVPVFSPEWLLREKLLTLHQRGGTKQATDQVDILNLSQLVSGVSLTSPGQVMGLRRYLHQNPDNLDMMRNAVVCDEVFDEYKSTKY